jgi:O-antigen ligase
MTKLWINNRTLSYIPKGLLLFGLLVSIGVAIGTIPFSDVTLLAKITAGLIIAVLILANEEIGLHLCLLTTILIGHGAIAQGLSLVISGVVLSPLDLVITVTIVSGLIQIVGRKLKVPATPMNIPVLFLFFIYALSALVGFALGNHWEHILRDSSYIFYYGLYFIVIARIRTEEQANWLLKTLLVTVGLLTLYGFGARLLDVRSPDAVGNYATYGWEVPLSGGSFQRAYGLISAWSFYMPVTLMAISLYIVGDRMGKSRFLLLMVATGCFISSLLTLTRGAFAGFLGGLIYLVFCLNLKSRVKLLIGLIIILAVVSLIVWLNALDAPGLPRVPFVDLMIERYWSVFDFSYSSKLAELNAWGRVLELRSAAYHVRANPIFGLGIGAASIYLRLPGQGIISVTGFHNGYAALIYKMGYWGLLSYLGLSLFILGYGLSMIPKIHNLYLRGCCAGFLAGYAALLVEQFSSPVSLLTSMAPYGAMALGLTVVVERLARQAASSKQQVGSREQIDEFAAGKYKQQEESVASD